MADATTRLPWRRRGRPRVYNNHALARLWKLPTWVSVSWSVGLLLFALIAVLAKQLDEELSKSTWLWIHKPSTQLWIGGAFATVIFLDSARRLISRFGSSRESRQREQVHKQLSAAIAAVSDESGVKAGDLGCGLFLIHRSWRHGERLLRVERVRLLETHSESGVAFRPGVGTVGMCWDLPNPAHHDWSSVNVRYHNDLPDRQKWEKTTKQAKHGFDYESWKIMVGRYAEVLAVPVRVHGELVGVLAIDRKWHEDNPDPPPCLNKPKIKAALGTIAQTLVPVIDTRR